MADLDLKTALSVFGKMPQEKIALVLEAAVEVATDKLTGKDLPQVLLQRRLNELEAQLGELAAAHYTGFLRELGPEHINSIRHFVRMLLSKTVDQDKIVSALRGVGLKEDHIRSALALMKIWAPGKILKVAKGRGQDEFSLKMRELFKLYLDGFLIREPVGRLCLIRMALEPEKGQALRTLLGEISRVDEAVQKARPFWWSEAHDDNLQEILWRRIPQLVLHPLASMADQWDEPIRKESLIAFLKEAQLPEYLAELYPFLGGGPVLPDPPESWEELTREAVQEDPAGFYLRFLTDWAFFYHQTRGSAGWKRTTASVEALLSRSSLLFTKEGEWNLDGFTPEGKDLVMHAFAMGATYPVPAAARMRDRLRLESPTNLNQAAKRYRQLKAVQQGGALTRSPVGIPP
ncbi:MAG: hypothetical protein J0L75_05960 [Spirochaetes bacterium]|nr:hypothetical protein [Spirochaetota bacterium]